jgi:hypothetical protein
MIRLRQAIQPSFAADIAAGAEMTVPASAADKPAVPATAYAVAWGAAAVGIVGGIFIAGQVQPAPFTPADGFSALALFYIAAQAVERIIEPFTGLVTAPAAEGAGSVKKPEAEAQRSAAIASAYKASDSSDKQQMTDLAASWHKVVEEIRNNTKIYAWGVATMLGGLASGYLGLYIMKAVGATGTPQWLDIAITGVIVGGGSKGLHDLIKNIEKAKETKEDPEEAG